MPFWVPAGDGSPMKPWIPLWTSRAEDFVAAGQMQAERGRVEDAVSLLKRSFEEEGRRPGRVEVSDPKLETLLVEQLDGSGIDIVLQKELEEVDDVLAGMADRLGGPDMPGALEVPGVTVDAMRSFATAAHAMYDAAPWQHLSARDLIEVRGGAPPGFRYAVVLGMGHTLMGLGFFDDKQSFWEMTAGTVTADNRWSFTYGPIMQLPPDDADLWIEQGLEVAEPIAYPMAFCAQSANRVKRPSPRVLDFLTGLLNVLAASDAADFDEGRFTRTVEAITGPREYELVLPFLFDPPTREDLQRHEVFPDPRAFERLNFLLTKRFTGSSLESADAIGDLMGGDRPIDEIPFEPADDRDRAQELCFKAYDAWGRHQHQLIEQALSLDPDCVDALVLQAERNPEFEQARKIYERAVSSAEDRLALEDTEDLEGGFWSYYPTRPYMRALHGLAHMLEAVDEPAEAITHYRRLLTLDEADHQSVRYCLLNCLLASGRFKDAESHIKTCESPAECVWPYARALAAFGRYGLGNRSQSALGKALAQNVFGAGRLLGIDFPPAPTETMDEDADSCAEQIREAWLTTPGALEWLEDALDDDDVSV